MFLIKRVYQIMISFVIILTLIVGLKPMLPVIAEPNLSGTKAVIEIDYAALERYPADKEIDLKVPEKTKEQAPQTEPLKIAAASTTRAAGTTTPARGQTSTTKSTTASKTTTPTAPAPKPSTYTAPAPTSTSSTKATALVSTAKQYIGVKYQWGGTTPSGFDCSGFTQYVYAKNGIKIPRVSRDQYTVGTAVSMSNLKAGDLVFFSLDGDKNKVIDHVGMFIGNGQFIHASSTKGVVISNLSTYWKNYYVGAKRII